MYSRQVEQDLHACERESIDDYIAQSGKMAHLHTQIRACDRILANMEDMLRLACATGGGSGCCIHPPDRGQFRPSPHIVRSRPT